MRTVQAIVVAAVTIGVLPVSVCAEDDAMAALVDVREALRSVATWKVPFEQEYIPAGFTEGDRTSGQLWLQWPDRMLFVSGSPPVQWLGLEGRRTRLLDLDAGTCEDHVLTDEEWERIPLVAVLDPQRAVELFTIMQGPAGEIVLLPRQRSDLERIELTARDNGLPAQLKIHDGQGSVNIFEFQTWSAADSEVSWIPEAPDNVSCFGE